MSRTVGEQVRSGFRLAGGVLSFCAGLFLLAYGLDAVWSDGHFVPSAWLGWVELSLAAVLIPLTMHLWIQFFAGCLGFGFLKAVLVALSGRDWFPPHLAGGASFPLCPTLLAFFARGWGSSTLEIAALILFSQCAHRSSAPHRTHCSCEVLSGNSGRRTGGPGIS